MTDEEIAPPTIAQVEAMSEALPPYIRAAIVVLAGSGLWVGEYRSAGDRQSQRTVPVGEVVVDVFLEHRREAVEGLALHDAGGWAPELPPLEDPMELRSSHAPGGRERGARARGREPIELSHMVTHDLWHFYASALIAGGASVKQVQMVLGHAPPSSRCGSTRTCGRAKKTAPGP